MYTVGGDYNLNPDTKITFEGAITNSDENTFSDIGNENDLGAGFIVGSENVKKISKKAKDPWFMRTHVSYEFRTDNFYEIQRYRSVEFDRDWNIQDQDITGTQQVPTAEIEFVKQDLGTFSYQFKSFLSGESYQGFRHELSADIDNSLYTVQLTASDLSSSGSLERTHFNRHKALIQKKYKALNIGFRDVFEVNTQKAPESDTLSESSYRFWEWEVFIVNGDTAKNKFNWDI